MTRTVALILLLASALTHAAPPPETALWNGDRSAAVATSRDGERTRVIAYVKQADGTFLEIDLSQVEGRNLGSLGLRSAADYDRIETTAVEWLPRENGLLQVVVRTRAWHSGQRFTVLKPVVFRTDGVVLWQ